MRSLSELTTVDQSILSASKAIKVRNGQIVATPDLIEATRLAYALQKASNKFFDNMRKAMVDNGVSEWEFDDSYVGFEPAIYFKASDGIDEEYVAGVTINVDGNKVRAYKELHNGMLPKGVQGNVISKFVKRIK